MHIDRSEEKLLNAIVFFASNIRGLGKTKLFKLLFLLDFRHFEQTGKSVTGLEYRAWPMGPVPAELSKRIKSPDEALQKTFQIQPERVYSYIRHAVRPLVEFDPSDFTPRELRLMESLAATYSLTTADDMVEVTHAEGGAWESVWQDGEGKDRKIPYERVNAEGEQHPQHVLEAAKEYLALAC